MNILPCYQRAAELIAGADALVIAAGAGIGVDSGLPDFRGSTGFWKAYPALALARLDFTEMASPAMFERDPGLAWGFYGHRLGLYRQTVPHAGFAILRKWAQRMQSGAWLFTSNVDGQFQKAGFAPEQIHECHGSIHYLQCMDDCASDVWPADAFTPVVDDSACRLLNAPPLCPHCGALARPNIVMFGDWRYQHQRTEAQRQSQERWLEVIRRSSARTVIVEIGAGTAIPSVRHFGQRLIRACGARMIRINPRAPQVASSSDVGLATGSLEALQGIDALLKG